ncbi:MAG: low molecular weight phosphotyrosine protein phosphatase [Azonexus sp.]|nr:low molecular weight protein-tyrosine-phosphatase [Azonexus sp.]MCK6412047.1 low molecular weight phosphotyrosine protein phosphatase [Azonexus sp.]
MTYRVLLVCMGNICRSPTAEGVLRRYIVNQGLGDKVEVDSAGTHGYHVGEAPDSRTQRAARARGYNLSQLRARKVAPQDLDYFDLILAMDKSNLDNLRRMATPEQRERIALFMDYARNFDDEEVPDPYYGLGHGFDLVLDMVEDASEGLVDHFRKVTGR